MQFDPVRHAANTEYKARQDQETRRWLKLALDANSNPERYRSSKLRKPKIESLSDDAWRTALFQEVGSRLVQDKKLDETLIERLLPKYFMETFDKSGSSIALYTKSLIDLVINPPGHVFDFRTTKSRNVGLSRDEFFKAIYEILTYADATYQAQIERQELTESYWLRNGGGEMIEEDEDDNDGNHEDYQQDAGAEGREDEELEYMDFHDKSDEDMDLHDEKVKDVDLYSEEDNPVRTLAELFQSQKQQSERFDHANGTIPVVMKDSFLDLAIATFQRHITFMRTGLRFPPKGKRYWKETDDRFNILATWLRTGENLTTGSEKKLSKHLHVRMSSSRYFETASKHNPDGLEDAQKAFAKTLAYPPMEYFFWQHDVNLQTLSGSSIPWEKLRLNKRALHIDNPQLFIIESSGGTKIRSGVSTKFLYNNGLTHTLENGKERTNQPNRGTFRLHALSDYYLRPIIWKDDPKWGMEIEDWHHNSTANYDAATSENLRESWEGPGLLFFMKDLKRKNVAEFLEEVKALLEERRVPPWAHADLLRFIKDDLSKRLEME